MLARDELGCSPGVSWDGRPGCWLSPIQVRLHAQCGWVEPGVNPDLNFKCQVVNPDLTFKSQVLNPDLNPIWSRFNLFNPDLNFKCQVVNPDLNSPQVGLLNFKWGLTWTQVVNPDLNPSSQPPQPRFKLESTPQPRFKPINSPVREMESKWRKLNYYMI